MVLLPLIALAVGLAGSRAGGEVTRPLDRFGVQASPGSLALVHLTERSVVASPCGGHSLSHRPRRHAPRGVHRSRFVSPRSGDQRDMTIESLLWFVIVLAFIGLLVGAVARVLVPGPTPMGILGTIGAGIAGAFIGGFIGRLLFGPGLSNGWSFLLSVVAAAGVVWLVSGRARTYRYGRQRDTLVYDRGYDDRVLVDDDRSYRPLARRRRFF